MARRNQMDGWPWQRPAGAIAVLAILTALVLPGAAAAQNERQGPFIVQAAQRLQKLTDQANAAGFKLDDNKFSMGGGWYNQSDKWMNVFNLTLKAGRTYRVIVAGDGDARDVDVALVEMKTGKVVAVDMKNDPEAMVELTPAATQKYIVRIRLFDSRENVPCVCLAVVMVK
jgi:hypothetical protein